MLETRNTILINDMGAKKCHRPDTEWQNTNMYCDYNHSNVCVKRENEKKQKKYFVIIPSEVLCNNNLIPNAKILYGDITALCNQEGYCWAWNSYFASKYQVSERTIQRWINNLIENGYIERDIEYFDTSKQVSRRLLKVKLADNGIDSIGMSGSDKNNMNGIDKNDTYNNTNYNNTNYNKLSKKETRVREEDLRAEYEKKLEEQKLEFEKKLKEQREYMDKSKIKYEELISKLLKNIEEQEKEEEIKKKPIDFYDVGEKIHSSYSENNKNKTSKNPGAGVENDNEELEYSSDSNTGRITAQIDDFKGEVVKSYQEIEKDSKMPLKFKNSKNDTSEQKKFYNRPSFNQLIEEYTDNEELRFELKQHLKVRKIKGVLCNYSIELGFRTLDTYAKTDREKILMVRNANEGGWTKFYELPKWQRPTGFETSYNIEEYKNNYI